MKWSIEYPMGKRLSSRRGLFCLLLMSCGFFYSKAADDKIRNLKCTNDYDTKMVCTWEAMKLETNCATEYRMIYERYILPDPNNICIPENVKVDHSAVPIICSCTILVSSFAAGDEYDIEIQSDGEVLLNDTIYPYLSIKPKTPENLIVEFNDNGDSILRWAKNNNLHIGNRLCFEIQYYNKQDPTEKYVIDRDQSETHFEISRSYLKLGYDYVARIRSRVKDGYKGPWSDWSNEIEWRNDRTNNFVYDSIGMIVTTSCILIVVLIVICSFVTRLIKKNSWDMIPNPAKSHFLIPFFGESQIPEKLHVHDRQPFSNTQWRRLKQTCWSWLIKLAPNLLDQDFIQKHAPKTTGNQPADGSQQRSKTSSPKNETDFINEQRSILKPESIIVEPWVVLINPPDSDKTLDDEIQSQDEDNNDFEDNDVMFCNSSINDMFRDLLGLDTCKLENSVIAIDEYKLCDNLGDENALQSKPDTHDAHGQHSSHSLSVFSFSNETNQINENEDSSGRTLQKPAQSIDYGASDYHSFESEVAHFEPKAHLGPNHLSGFHPCSENLVDVLMLLQNAQSLPVNELDKNLLGVLDSSELDFDPQYHSFNSAVSSGETQFKDIGKYHGTPSPMSLGGFAVSDPLTYSEEQTQGLHTSQQCYFNDVSLGCQRVGSQNGSPPDFKSQEEEEDSFLMTNRENLGEIAPVDISNNAVDIDSTALFDPSGYQSFENAIQQGKGPNDDKASPFPEDGALSGITPGPNKEETPFDILFWASHMRKEGLDSHVFPTGLMHSTVDVCNDKPKGSGSHGLNVGEIIQHELGGALLPLPCNETTNEDTCRVVTEAHKKHICPTICSGGMAGNAPDTKNMIDDRTIQPNNNVLHSALTLNTDDHLKQFDKVNIYSPQFNKAINGEFSFINHFPNKTEASLSQNPEIGKLPHTEGLKDQVALTTQTIPICVQPPEEPPTAGKCPLLKYENMTYFLQPNNTETQLFLKENHISTTTGRKAIKHNMVKLNEAINTDGNSYMTVTEMENEEAEEDLGATNSYCV